jgi:hypothetical protein
MAPTICRQSSQVEQCLGLGVHACKWRKGRLFQQY